MNRAKELFLYAVESLEPEQWVDYLTEACGGDETLRDSVQKLLAAHRQPDSLLNGVESENGAHSVDRIGTTVGRYKLLSEIGEGGFANVYLAEQSEPVRRHVAVKILKLGMDTKEVIARFEVERQALALMDHPYIARVIDGGATSEGRPYFVMELIEGRPITQYCDERRLGIEERLRLFIAVTQAVQHAHQKGIVHRDIKPSNVMVTDQQGKPIPKVIDFGIAKVIDQDLTDKTLITRQCQFIGTPQYISPEQANSGGSEVDTRSDVYSLGVLLYEMLTGLPPYAPERFRSGNLAEIVRIISEEQPPRPSQRLRSKAKGTSAQQSSLPIPWLRSLEGDLDWIVTKAMEKEPNRRYITVAALADDVARFLNDEPITARPPSLGYRVQKFVRRNKLGIATGAAFAVVLMAATILSLGLARKAQWEADRANSTLGELRSSASAFISEARALVAEQQFDDAISKIEYAIRLQPENVDYALAKAELLECQLKFKQADAAYQEALRIDPASSQAKIHQQKCYELHSQRDDAEKGYSLRLLAELHELMQSEQRSAAELLPIARILGNEQKHLLDFWLQRLESLPISGNKPLDQRLTVSEGGELTLDLSRTQVRDLAALQGMPLSNLNLSGCSQLTSIEPLADLPLKTLNLSRTPLSDFTPLQKLPTLEELDLAGTEVSDLKPLAVLALKKLSLHRCPVIDVTPLQNLPLEELNIGYTRVTSLSPLRGLPLRVLDASYVPAEDIREVQGAPLEKLQISGTGVRYLAFLRGMPLRELSLWDCERAHTYSVLGELEKLEVLQLPGFSINSFSEDDRLAIDELQSRTLLTQISDRLPPNGSLSSVEHRDKFWPIWNAKRELQRRLLARNIECLISSAEPNSWDIQIITPGFDDLTLLAGEPIRDLNINGTKVSDLTPIVEMKTLRTLWAGNTPVDNVEPLRGSPIARLSLADTPVSDIQALAEVSNLRQLWLGNTLIDSLEPLRCLKLSTLRVENTSIDDLGPLRGMPLETLGVSGTRVTNLDPLRGAPLKTLYLNFTPVSDVSPLVDCRKLERLLLPIGARDLDSLKSLSELNWLQYGWSPHPDYPNTTTREFWDVMGDRGQRPPLEKLIPAVEPLARRGLCRQVAEVLEASSEDGSLDDTVLARMVVCAMHLAAGNENAYRREAEELLAEAGTTDSPYLADQTLKACLMSAATVGTEEDWEALAENVQLNTRDIEFQPWLHLSATLLSYREADYYQTIKHAGTLIHRQEFSLEAKVAALALRAMSHQELGEIEEAKRDLEEGERLIAMYWPYPQKWSRASWHDWMIARLWLDEARQLIGNE